MVERRDSWRVNLQMERPPNKTLAQLQSVSTSTFSEHTFGGIRVESARRVTKLILMPTGVVLASCPMKLSKSFAQARKMLPTSIECSVDLWKCDLCIVAIEKTLKSVGVQARKPR
jgi:hypothetical protein